MLQQYREHVAERAAQGIPPKPLNAEQVAALVELLKNPPKGEEDTLVDLLVNRVPPGVDEAAYVKAGFLAALANGEATSSLISAEYATELLGTMMGGYNIQPLISLLDNDKLAPIAAKALSHTLLIFDAFHDVTEKADAGNARPAQSAFAVVFLLGLGEILRHAHGSGVGSPGRDPPGRQHATRGPQEPPSLYQSPALVPSKKFGQTKMRCKSQRDRMFLASSGFLTPLSSAFWAAALASAFFPLYSSTLARLR